MTNFKKLSAVVLGSLLAIGVGAGVVANNDNAQATHAAGTYSASISKATATAYTTNVADGLLTFGTANNNIKMASNTGTASFTVAYAKNASSTTSIFNNSASEIRLYGGSTNGAQLTFTILGDFLMNSIQVNTSTNSGYSVNGGSTITGAAVETALTDATTVVIKNVAASTSQVRITSIAIGYSAKSVSSKVLTDELELSGSLTTTTQFAGKTLDVTGLTVTAVYDDSSTSVLNAAQLTLPTLVYGTNSYQISYTEGSVTATAMVGVTVAQDTVASLSWTGRVTTFNEGSVFTLGAGAVTATYASSATAPVTLANLTVYVFEGTFDAGTARVLAPTDTFVMADNGKSIVLGYQGVYTTSSVLTIKFVPTTTYGSNGATLVTNASNLAIGDSIVVTAAAGTYALGTTQGSNNRNAVAIVVADNAISPVGSAVQVLTIAAGTKANTFALNTGSGYLYAASSSSNYLKTQATIDDNASFAITITEAGVATITAQGTNTRNIIKFNSTNNPPIFSCYSTGQADVSIFKISGGYNYDFVLGMLDGDYCSASLDDLNLAVARHDAMTAHEIAQLESVTVVGKDSVSYTGLAAYQALLARRNALAAAGIGGNGNFNMEDTSVIAIITIISLVGVSAIGGFFYFKKKHLA